MDTTPCPACGERIPYGNGVQRDGKRLHWGCAVVSKRPAVNSETRLPSGAYV